MNTTTLPAGYELPAELLANQRTLDDLVAKAKKTRAAVDETAAQLPLLDADVQESTAALAIKDADRWTADDSKVKGLDAEIAKLVDALDSKQRALNRARNALVIHEARAPEVDDQLQAAVIVLENDLIRYADGAMEQLRAELLEKVAPIQGVFAALRAVDVASGGARVRGIVNAAFIPDLKGGADVDLRIYAGTNLLAQPPEPEHCQLAQALTAALAPVRASLAAAKSLGRYVPLDRRPKPPVLRGYSHGAKDDAAWRARNDPAEAQASDSVETKTPLDRAKSLVRRLA